MCVPSRRVQEGGGKLPSQLQLLSEQSNSATLPAPRPSPAPPAGPGAALRLGPRRRARRGADPGAGERAGAGRPGRGGGLGGASPRPAAGERRPGPRAGHAPRRPHRAGRASRPAPRGEGGGGWRRSHGNCRVDREGEGRAGHPGLPASQRLRMRRPGERGRARTSVPPAPREAGGGERPREGWGAEARVMVTRASRGQWPFVPVPRTGSRPCGVLPARSPGESPRCASREPFRWAKPAHVGQVGRLGQPGVGHAGPKALRADLAGPSQLCTGSLPSPAFGRTHSLEADLGTLQPPPPTLTDFI